MIEAAHTIGIKWNAPTAAPAKAGKYNAAFFQFMGGLGLLVEEGAHFAAP
jgi:hypothetical protein